MFKKLLVTIATLVASIGFAFAQVDVNKADQAALDSVKGIGPVMSKKILDERKKGGNFKDWPDFQTRVKGIGEKNSAKLSKAGLTVNNQALANATVAPVTSPVPAVRTRDTKPTMAPTKPGGVPMPVSPSSTSTTQPMKK
jgi:competence protein ComEA